MTDADRKKVGECRKEFEREILVGSFIGREVESLFAVIDRLEADRKLDHDILGDWLGHSEDERARIINDVIERAVRETAERCWLLACEVKKDLDKLSIPTFGGMVAGASVQIDRAVRIGVARTAALIAKEFGLEEP